MSEIEPRPPIESLPGGEIASSLAGAFLALMDQTPGVLNMLGLAFTEGKTGRTVQVTLEYVKPGVKSPVQIMSELRAENEELKSRLVKIANIEAI